MSDGFTIDASRAIGGVIIDGLDLANDVDFVPETQPYLSGTWVGFNDEEYGYGGFTYKVRLSLALAALRDQHVRSACPCPSNVQSD